MSKSITVGKLRVDSGTVVVTDPCYIPKSLGGKGTFVVPNFAQGEIEVCAEILDDDETRGWGKRVAQLSLHAGTSGGARNWEYLGEAFVDSGQMSFIDWRFLPLFRQEDFNVNDDLEAHANALSYRGACNATLHSENSVAVFADNRMVASSSGYGDGAYEVQVCRDDEGVGRILTVTFITEEDEDGDW